MKSSNAYVRMRRISWYIIQQNIKRRKKGSLLRILTPNWVPFLGKKLEKKFLEKDFQKQQTGNNSNKTSMNSKSQKF